MRVVLPTAAVCLAGSIVLTACTSGRAAVVEPTTPAPRAVVRSSAPAPKPTLSRATPARPRKSRKPAPKPTTSTPAPPPTSTAVPPVSPAQAAVGLLDVRTIVPDAIIDLQLATADNWMHRRIYPADARCLVHKSMVADLTKAAATLRAQGYRLVFWDCYRPRVIQAQMFELVHHNRDWIAPPGKKGTQHTVGRAIDVSLAYRDGSPVDMGSGWCTFTPISWTTQKGYGLTKQQIRNRMVLLRGMAAGGMWNYKGEFWHYNGPGSHIPRPHLDVPIN